MKIIKTKNNDKYTVKFSEFDIVDSIDNRKLEENIEYKKTEKIV